MSTAFAEAFRTAGYVDPSDAAYAKLMEVAVEAWGKWSTPEGGGARRDRVRGYLCRETTLWTLLERCNPQALGMAITYILNEARSEIEHQRDAEKSASGGGHVDLDSRPRHAPSAHSRNAGRPADDAGHADDGNQFAHARVVPSSPDRVWPQAERGSEPARLTMAPRGEAPAAPTTREAERLAAILRVHERLSRLDTILIEGKPIGDCTVYEVRRWIDVRMQDQKAAARDVLFARQLISNLPGDAIVRKWVKTNEADSFYTRAETENAA